MLKLILTQKNRYWVGADLGMVAVSPRMGLLGAPSDIRENFGGLAGGDD